MIRFNTEQSNLKHRNGRAVTVIKTITEADPEPGFDPEVLPMHRIRFADGFVTECWPDELVEFSATGNRPYRDTL